MKYQDELDALESNKTTIESRIAVVEAKIASLNVILTSNTLRMRQLAIGIHTLLCPGKHDGSDCSWFSVENENDPDLVDWEETAHALWLDRAKHGVAKMSELGFIVSDPE